MATKAELIEEIQSLKAQDNRSRDEAPFDAKKNKDETRSFSYNCRLAVGSRLCVFGKCAGHDQLPG